MVALLDANVLIAAAVAEHEHHDRVALWLSGVDRIALCPVVEGALVRFVVRMGERVEVAQAIVRAFHSDPRSEFWPDSVSYAQAGLGRVRGHRQVTDAYLVALAAAHEGGVVATLDEGLAQNDPARTVVIPA